MNGFNLDSIAKNITTLLRNILPGYVLLLPLIYPLYVIFKDSAFMIYVFGGIIIGELLSAVYQCKRSSEEAVRNEKYKFNKYENALYYFIEANLSNSFKNIFRIGLCYSQRRRFVLDSYTTFCQSLKNIPKYMDKPNIITGVRNRYERFQSYIMLFDIISKSWWLFIVISILIIFNHCFYFSYFPIRFLKSIICGDIMLLLASLIYYILIAIISCCSLKSIIDKCLDMDSYMIMLIKDNLKKDFEDYIKCTKKPSKTVKPNKNTKKKNIKKNKR